MFEGTKAIPKMCGLETEFGVINMSQAQDAFEANLNFIESAGVLKIPEIFSIRWDPEERTGRRSGPDDPDAENHGFMENRKWLEKDNYLLANGARLYLDGAHAEISTPICRNAKELVIWNRACYRIINKITDLYEARGIKYAVLRNNLGEIKYGAENRRRNSFACHENYTVSRKVPFDTLVSRCIPWFVLRTPVIGAGKTGSDIPGDRETKFQISQRADFFMTDISLDTMVNRGIFNTRDAPYADRKRFRRLHVIPGDSNMLELPEYLKVGLTSILLMMIEDGALDNRFTLVNPVGEFLSISRDLDFSHRLTLQNQKKSRTTLDLLWDYYELFFDYCEAYHPENEIFQDVLGQFAGVLKKLWKKDHTELYGVLDWTTKLAFLREALASEGESWQSAYATGLDYEYHDNSPESMFHRDIFPESARVISDEEIEAATAIAPPTRSRWIVECCKKFSGLVYDSTHWDKIHVIDRQNTGQTEEIYFPDPTMNWDDDASPKLFSLPHAEFLRHLKIFCAEQLDG